jgi:hypothetical protein
MSMSAARRCAAALVPSALRVLPQHTCTYGLYWGWSDPPHCAFLNTCVSFLLAPARFPFCTPLTTDMSSLPLLASPSAAPGAALLPADTNGGGNTVLCPYSCLNLGSFATLFRLGQNCICDQQRLNALLTESMTISTVRRGGGVDLCFGGGGWVGRWVGWVGG